MNEFQINPEEVLLKKIIYSDNNDIITDKNNKENQLQQVGIDLRIADDLILKPMHSQLFKIYEKFDMQEYFALSLSLRSSFCRKGLILSSTVFDPGFKGVGGAMLYNFSDTEIEIKKLTRIAQIVIFKANYSSLYDGYYKNNNDVNSKFK